MVIFLTISFIIILNFPSTESLANCAAGVVCPPSGIWSEWVTTDTCATSCGSCSKQFYTRNCLSTSFNSSCTCTGDSTRYLPCNTSTCVYPAQRTCCIPYVPMLINGSMQCGPIPTSTDTGSSTTSCCPVGGVWSKWSAFARNDDDTAWVQTRSCLSENAGCPCTGISKNSTSGCPCRTMLDVTKAVSVGINSILTTSLTINDSSCEAIGTLSRVSNACSHYNSDEFGASLIRYVKTDQSEPYTNFYVFECNGYNQASVVTFYCDLSVLYWRLMFNNDALNGWAQVALNA